MPRGELGGRVRWVDSVKGSRVRFRHCDDMRGRSPATLSLRTTSSRTRWCGRCARWLYTILTNLNRNRLRALARRPALQAIDDNDAPETAGPEAGARDIERALASLVEDQRTALLLVVLEGLTYREVAEVQGVPIGTVMSRLARARMQIKAYLDGERPALRRIK